MKKVLNLERSRRAFTLIELLVVIAIIGILASMILTSLGTVRQKAKQAAALSAMRSVKNIVDMCIIDGGRLVMPSLSGDGGTNICNNGSSGTLPNISNTSFRYCGGSCGGWFQQNDSYAISAYTDDLAGGRKAYLS